MTAPRWIAEALETALTGYNKGDGVGDIDIEQVAAALIEHLPLEAMVTAAVNSATGDGATDRALARQAIAKVIRVLTDGDLPAVQLTEIYQRACRALDAAGVPYAIDVEIPPHLVVEAAIGDLAAHRPADVRHVSACPGQLMLDLAGRIAWLAQQRPTRLDLQRVAAERDRAQKELAECYATIHSHQQRLAELHRQIVELEKARPDGATP